DGCRGLEHNSGRRAECYSNQRPQYDGPASATDNPDHRLLGKGHLRAVDKRDLGPDDDASGCVDDDADRGPDGERDWRLDLDGAAGLERGAGWCADGDATRRLDDDGDRQIFDGPARRFDDDAGP